MPHFILLLLSTTVALQQTSLAQPPQSVYVQRMMSLDKNGDGFLTADEMPGKLAQELKTNDSDADGRLSPQELTSMEASAKAARNTGSANSDSMGDTNIARPQRAQRRNRNSTDGVAGTGLDPAQILRFALTFDANQDGGLDAEELKKYAVGMAARRAGVRGVQGSNHQPGRAPRLTPRNATPAKGLSTDGKGDGGFGD